MSDKKSLAELKADFEKAHWDALKAVMEAGVVEFDNNEEAQQFYMFLSRTHQKNREKFRERHRNYVPLPKQFRDLQTVESYRSFSKEEYYSLSNMSAALMHRRYQEALDEQKKSEDQK